MHVNVHVYIYQNYQLIQSHNGFVHYHYAKYSLDNGDDAIYEFDLTMCKAGYENCLKIYKTNLIRRKRGHLVSFGASIIEWTTARSSNFDMDFSIRNISGSGL